MNRATPANEPGRNGRFGLVLSLTGMQSAALGLMIMAAVRFWWFLGFASDVQMDGMNLLAGEVMSNRVTKGTLAGRYCRNPGSWRGSLCRKWLSTMRRTSTLLQPVSAVMPLWLLSARVSAEHEPG
ncbi:hypothetical protein ACNKHV_08575 [Shigella flexneri]